MSSVKRKVFIAGGTGYMGRALAGALIGRGHSVRVLARPASFPRVPEGCVTIAGDALDSATYAERVRGADVFVHLIGTPSPSPTKARDFLWVDLESVREALKAVAGSGVRHFVYVSVAQPAPVMHAYVMARAQAEASIRQAAVPATILRPWYVLGPGHQWPRLLLPLYWLAALVPPFRAGARRLGFVTLEQMVTSLVSAVEAEPDGVRIVDVPAIRSGA
jgi:nucleoside-diphosphate-sugar epimerase